MLNAVAWAYRNVWVSHYFTWLLRWLHERVRVHAALPTRRAGDVHISISFPNGVSVIRSDNTTKHYIILRMMVWYIFRTGMSSHILVYICRYSHIVGHKYINILMPFGRILVLCHAPLVLCRSKCALAGTRLPSGHEYYKRSGNTFRETDCELYGPTAALNCLRAVRHFQPLSRILWDLS